MAAWPKQKTFGSRVRRQLARVGMTVGELAVLIECSPGYLHRVLRGEQEPSWSLGVRIARALNVWADELTDEYPVDVPVSTLLAELAVGGRATPAPRH